jgi:glucuronate isomerase
MKIVLRDASLTGTGLMNLTDRLSEDLYSGIAGLPIVSPHGHCDPSWFSENVAFPDPARLLVVPDHYLFRMLYSQGVPLEELGLGAGSNRDGRDIFRTFAAHWHLFLGTPSRIWMEQVLRSLFGVTAPLNAETSDQIYNQIAECLARPEFRPRALFQRFGIEVLATTDHALDGLGHHAAIRASGWNGRVVPTFRPDSLIDPNPPDFRRDLALLGAMTGEDVEDFDGYLAAIRARRDMFIALGAAATDHAIDVLDTTPVAEPEKLYQSVRKGAGEAERRAFHAHMLTVMAEMSLDDGLVMQLHAGSRRNTNPLIFETFGPDKGADIPVATDWVRGLGPLLERVGNRADFRLILFTLDESTYTRELAPMAGHWPCLRVGPPWWFHDSPAGIARYLDRVVETAGYWNLAGFNDDTRAFLSIPARHDLWRRGVAVHLSAQVGRGYFSKTTAEELAGLLAVDLARDTYRL